MAERKIRLLIVDDEEIFLRATATRLEVRGFEVTAVDRGDKALEVVRRQPVDIALVDLKMPGISGEETLRELKRISPHTEVVILTGHGSIESAVECTKEGAYSYLQKPCELEPLLGVLTEAYRRRVMNKQKIQEERMEQFLRDAQGESPLGILRRLRELDEERD